MSTYTVQAGDNLTKIAKAHNTTVEELARKNNISDPNKILIGQKLTLGDVSESNVPEAQQTPAQNETLIGMDTFERTEVQDTTSPWLYAIGGAASVKALDYAMPYVAKGTKSAGKAAIKGGKAALNATANAAVNGGKAALKGAHKVTKKVTSSLKHAAERAKHKYVTGKDAIKTAGKNVVKTGKQVAKGAELEYAFAKDAVKQGIKTASSKGGKILKLTKTGKALGRVATPLAVAVSTVEIYDAYKEEGVKGAAKQGVKTGSGLACAAIGAKVGAIAGACTGPAAVVAVPVLTAIGAAAGYLGGEKLAEKLMSWFS